MKSLHVQARRRFDAFLIAQKATLDATDLSLHNCPAFEMTRTLWREVFYAYSRLTYGHQKEVASC